MVRAPSRRSRAIVTIAIVSAVYGGGFALGGLLAGLALNNKGVPSIVGFLIAAAGAIAGIWVGARIANRLTGGTRRRFLAMGVGGMPGFVASIGLGYAASQGVAVLALVALFCPGIAAALGGSLTERATAWEGARPAPPGE